jgi:hypothetical protein
MSDSPKESHPDHPGDPFPLRALADDLSRPQRFAGPATFPTDLDRLAVALARVDRLRRQLADEMMELQTLLDAHAPISKAST